METFIYGYWLVLAAIAGACVASFVAVVATRLPAGRSLGGRSLCACGRPLTVADLIPVVGWLRCRGVARCCGARLDPAMVIGEATLAAVYAAAVINGHPLSSTLIIVTATLAYGVFMWNRGNDTDETASAAPETDLP